ncbi:MAG: hypothetical protein J6X55_11790, partial [Victivallales bacterium]|nr:hypothetical protein [Victivallales bacterium]
MKIAKIGQILGAVLAVAMTADGVTFPFHGTLSGDKVAIHSRATVNSESLDYLKKGVEIEVFSEKGDWYRIGLPENVQLWIEQSALGENDTLQKNAVMYVGPSPIFSDIGSLKAGDKVKRVNKGPHDGFVAITAPPSARGWIYKRYVQMPPELAEDNVVANPPVNVTEIQKKVDNMVDTTKRQEELKATMAAETANLAADREKLKAMEADAAKLRSEREKMENSLKTLHEETARLERQREEASLKAAQVKAE